MQIRSRLTYQFTYLVSAILFVSYFIIYIFTQENYKDKFYSRLRQKANTTAQLLVNVNQVDSKLMGIIGQTNRDLLYRESILVYDLCNERIYASNDSINLHIDVDLIIEKDIKPLIDLQYDLIISTDLKFLKEKVYLEGRELIERQTLLIAGLRKSQQAKSKPLNP